jgi:FkbM family methyltransferase
MVFDVGAHAGQMARLFARMVPRAHVHAFAAEADDDVVWRPAEKVAPG